MTAHCQIFMTGNRETSNKLIHDLKIWLQ